MNPRTALHTAQSSLHDSPCQNPVLGRGKVIIINADDIGMHTAIDDATVLLAEMKRVSSASVMSLGAPGKDVITELSRLNVDLGLHLDFTSVFANRRYDADRSVRSLLIDSWSRRIDVTQVQHIVDDQLQRFEMITGRAPTFIDGHQHVHQFPVIRDGLIQALAIRYPGQRFFMRNTDSATWRGFKAWLIGALGTPGLLGLAERAGHTCNVDFCGVYDFSEQRDMSRSWRSWLASSPPFGGLVMCHPALTSHPDDVIGKARANEFKFLRSEQFSELIDDAGIEIAGWNSHQRRPQAAGGRGR